MQTDTKTKRRDAVELVTDLLETHASWMQVWEIVDYLNDKGHCVNDNSIRRMLLRLERSEVIAGKRVPGIYHGSDSDNARNGTPKLRVLYAHPDVVEIRQ